MDSVIPDLSPAERRQLELELDGARLLLERALGLYGPAYSELVAGVEEIGMRKLRPVERHELAAHGRLAAAELARVGLSVRRYLPVASLVGADGERLHQLREFAAELMLSFALLAQLESLPAAAQAIEAALLGAGQADARLEALAIEEIEL